MEIKCAYTKLVGIDSLIPNPRNTNDHPQRQIEALAKIIKVRGMRHPIIISKRSGFVIAGHGRIEACKKLGMENIPIDEQDFENEADEYSFLEADNHIATYAEFNEAKMLDNLKELNIDLVDFDFNDLGMLDFKLPIDLALFDEQKPEEKENEYKIEVKFPNDMEMMDIHDDLLSRGYLVKKL